MTKPTDDKFNSLSFLTKLTKSLLYSREKVKICAVFVTFVVFDRLSVANFPSGMSPAHGAKCDVSINTQLTPRVQIRGSAAMEEVKTPVRGYY